VGRVVRKYSIQPLNSLKTRHARLGGSSTRCMAI
jgi:hypothetical protein